MRKKNHESLLKNNTVDQVVYATFNTLQIKLLFLCCVLGLDILPLQCFPQWGWAPYTEMLALPFKPSSHLWRKCKRKYKRRSRVERKREERNYAEDFFKKKRTSYASPSCFCVCIYVRNVHTWSMRKCKRKPGARNKKQFSFPCPCVCVCVCVLLVRACFSSALAPAFSFASASLVWTSPYASFGSP